MEAARFVRTMGFFCVLGLAGFAGGCGPGGTSAPVAQKEGSAELKKAHFEGHRQLKADAQRVRAEAAKSKGTHRGVR
jgi:hypothetical protein